jgi:hypothetical protein
MLSSAAVYPPTVGGQSKSQDPEATMLAELVQRLRTEQDARTPEDAHLASARALMRWGEPRYIRQLPRKHGRSTTQAAHRRNGYR